MRNAVARIATVCRLLAAVAPLLPLVSCHSNAGGELAARLGITGARDVRVVATGWEDAQTYFRFEAPPVAIGAAARRLGLRCGPQRESPERLTPAPLERWEWRGLRPAGTSTVDWWHPERLAMPEVCAGEVRSGPERARYRLAFEPSTGLAYLEIHSAQGGDR